MATTSTYTRMHHEELEAAHDQENKLLHDNKMELSFLCTDSGTRFCPGCNKYIPLEKFDPEQKYHWCS